MYMIPIEIIHVFIVDYHQPIAPYIDYSMYMIPIVIIHVFIVDYLQVLAQKGATSKCQKIKIHFEHSFSF